MSIKNISRHLCPQELLDQVQRGGHRRAAVFLGSLTEVLTQDALAAAQTAAAIKSRRVDCLNENVVRRLAPPTAVGETKAGRYQDRLEILCDAVGKGWMAGATS